MKIFVLGLVLVALTEVISATKSDDGKKDGQESKIKRSQLDMLLTQMKQQQDQIQRLQEVDEQQRLQVQQQELKNEELQLQLREQREENQEQRQVIKELTKIKRERRSDNGTVEDMKKLIHDEVDPLIDALESRVSGLSQCELGFYNTSYLTDSGFGETKTIFFARNFTQTPKVITSVALIQGEIKRAGWSFGVRSVPQRPTTTQFDLYINWVGMNLAWGVSWMACA